ncbi:MAG: DUF3567 domain-containing protein [Leptothrix sp. (in: b-proteobacteria)]
MQMLYNSENYAVVQFEVDAASHDSLPDLIGLPATVQLKRGGYEIVDKHARREIFIEGAVAEHFKQGVHDLMGESPNEDDIDEYLSHFTVLAQQPVVLH